MQTVAIVGLGYFSQFHQAAWDANADAELVAVADLDLSRAQQIADTYGARAFSDPVEMADELDPAIIDLVVPPVVHADLIRKLLRPGRTIICQKPFCTSPDEARAVAQDAKTAGVTLVIHENFRFQPWHRTTKSLLESGKLGHVHNAYFTVRPGDGRGPDAYLSRQPSFQRMPRFLIQETVVHQMDTLQYLLGPVTSVYADLTQINPAISGEDAGIVILTHKSGAKSIIDGNRHLDHIAKDRRRTMGELTIEGENGTVSLNGDGALSFRAFDTNTVTPVELTAPVDTTTFGGGCVAALISHVVDCTKTGKTPENTAHEYLGVMNLVEAAYQSAKEARKIDL